MLLPWEKVIGGLVRSRLIRRMSTLAMRIRCRLREWERVMADYCDYVCGLG